METQNEISQLLTEFKRIKNMGYVKSSRKGTTGIGKTFEDLIGKNEDRLEMPDYNGIEIKSKLGYTNSYITLFNATPMGKEEYQIKRILQNYGYHDKIMPSCKVLQNSIFSNFVTLVGNRYFFKLDVDKVNQKVYLNVGDKDMHIIEKKEAYWDFSLLEEKIYRKLRYLAIVKAWPKKIGKDIFYKYYDIKIYKLKTLDNFINLLKKGDIRVTFKIGVFRSGERLGEVHDRGTSFEIQEKNLLDLYDRIY